MCVFSLQIAHMPNKRIDGNIFSSQKWEIEEQFAHEQLQWYAHQLELLAQGVAFEELELQKRRQESLATVFVVDNGYQAIKGATHDLSSQDIPAGSFAHLKLSGVMRMEDGLSSRGIQHMANNIGQAEANPNIRGGIIEANTGGGQAMAGTVLKNALQEAKKPWIVYYHQLASAGVKGTLPARALYGSGEEAQIGSIGSMVSINKRVLNYYQNNVDDIYADQSGNKNREFREYLMGNRGPIIEKLNRSNEFFIQAVKKYRNINGTEEQRERVFSGAMLFSDEAKEVGLSDGVATFNEAINHLVRESQADARSGAFHNYNNPNRMNFKEFFQQRIMPLINTKLNLAISEEAQPEEIEKAIDGAQGVAEAREEAREEMQEEVAKQVRQQLNESKGGQAGGQEEKSGEPMEAIQQTLQEMQEQIQELSKQNKALEGKLAVKKNTAADQRQAGNTGSPDVEQFETVKGFREQMSPEGTSKY